VTIRTGGEGDVAVAAALHASQICEGFLPTLGQPFLRRLYRRIVRWPGAFLLVAADGDTVIGMAAGTEDVGGLYRAFILHDGLTAGLVAGPRLVRSWAKVRETLRYPAGEGGLPRAELLSVAVDPLARGKGVGGELVAAANDEFAHRGVTAARVVAAAHNAAALRLYGSAGYRPAARIEVHAGAPSEVLTWS
jgi:ribosomal protein S18 acetylase RimI-like enzyme